MWFCEVNEIVNVVLREFTNDPLVVLELCHEIGDSGTSVVSVLP